ncbi:LuxR family transcriptional regulator [bacterium]|nr:MAG: LuxR family transcriptional regulator [bacterium]
MNYTQFSKNEMMNILEVIQNAVACNTESDIISVLKKTGELVSGAYSICGIGKCRDEQLIEIKNIVNVNYPAEWLETYNSKKLYEKDPVILHQSRHSGVQLWSDTYKMYDDKIYSEFIDEAADYDIRYGVSGGVHTAHDGMASIITFSNKKNCFKAHHKAILTVLTPHIHQAMTRLVHNSKKELLSSLTPRENEILKWMVEGKTNWEISVILGISERTASFHVQNIEEKLNAVNKIHAVAIACEQGFTM